MADHFVSEAIYLSAQDRDLLLGAVDEQPFDGLAAGTVMGHVHLRVAEIPATVGFDADVLGLGSLAALGEQAVFLSAGGVMLEHFQIRRWRTSRFRLTHAISVGGI